MRISSAAAQAQSDRSVADDLRMPMDGNDVLLFLSLHVAGTNNTQDDLLGRAALPVQVLLLELLASKHHHSIDVC